MQQADTERDLHHRLRYVPCEHCGGTGEIICRDGEYRSGWPEPNDYAILCSACDGYGMECVETESITLDDLASNEDLMSDAERSELARFEQASDRAWLRAAEQPLMCEAPDPNDKWE